MNNAIMSQALAALVPALWLDGEGNLLYASDAAVALLQPAAGNKVGANFSGIFGTTADAGWQALQQAQAAGGQASFEMLCHTGQWLEWTLQPAPDNGYLLTGYDITARRLREEQLREDERFYRQVLENLPIGLQEFTPDGLHVDINSKQKEIWGADHPLFTQPGYNLLEDPIYQQNGLSRLFHDALLQDAPVKKEILLQYREVAEGDAIRIRPCYYEATVFPIRDQQQAVTDLFLILNEITEKKLAEISLEKSERLLNNIVENLPIGYIQFDHLGFIRRVNQTQRRFFGTPSAMSNMPYNITSDPFARRFRLDQLFLQALEEQRVLRVERRLDFSQEGRWTNLDREVVLDLTVFPLQDPVDKKQIVVALVNDTTDKKLEHEIRNELLRNTELLRLFFDAVDMGYAAVEKDGRLNFLNRKAEQMIGREIAPGSNIFEVFPGLVNTPFAVRLAGALKSQVSESFISYFPRMDKWYEFLLTPMRDGAVSVFIRDITQSRKMQKDLHKANEQLSNLNRSLLNQNKQLEDFAHITSHNLRAPIANLKALMQMYNESVVLQERELYLGMLQEVIRKIDETLNDLVEVVQIRKDLNIGQERLVFAERLQHVKDVLLVDIEFSGLQLTSSFEMAPSLDFPRVYLDSILQNLVTNAIRYRTVERIPSLHFRSWKENGQTILTAEDNGVGIDMERFGSKLFGFRKTFHKNKDAKGIGLFITKTQIEAMGGSIRAESTPGRGTKFIITFKSE